MNDRAANSSTKKPDRFNKKLFYLQNLTDNALAYLVNFKIFTLEQLFFEIEHFKASEN